METADVVIAGAGIIGLSLALDLAAHGLRVTVLEHGRAMGESSWAAAGMLAAADPENPSPLAELARQSLGLYPKFLARLEDLSSQRVPLRTELTLQAGHALPTLSPAELNAIVPGLTPGDRPFFSLKEQSLDPRDLCFALPLAVRAAGVTLLEATPALSTELQAAGVVVETSAGSIAAAHFVNCAGAWAASPAFAPRAAGHPRIVPRKGQMTTVRLRGAQTLPHVVRTPELYLVPRGDQRVTIGATVESCGFDKAVEPAAIAGLLQAAAQLFPAIAEAEILESWAGLRPGSFDDLPLIGNSGHPNSWIAAGHFRNGILLAPGTADALSRLLRGESPAGDLSPFDPARTGPRRGNLQEPRPVRSARASDNPSTAAL